jgi:predicted CXXCH cytochrome family protein
MKKTEKINRWYLPGRVQISFFLVFLLCTLGGLILAARSLVFAADMQILTPQPSSTIITREPETHLVLRKSGAVTPIQVRSEQSGALLKPVVTIGGEEYIYLHFRLPLTPGLNKFSIVPGTQQIEFTYQSVQGLLPLNMKNFYLFHKNDQLPETCVECHDLQETGTIDPVGLKQQTSCLVCHINLLDKKAWKHSASINQQCYACHQQSVNPWKIGFREGKIDETCFTCHTGKKSEWQSSKHRHGVMIGGCTLCHNPHGAKYRYQLWAEGSLDLCVFCHSDKRKLLDKENPLPYVHGIILGAGCTICHDPHASENPFMLKKPINNLCIGCHQELAGVVRGHPVDMHPVKGSSDPRRPGREFSCTSCHYPHGSTTQYLLIETTMGARLCGVCHKK